MLQHLQLYDCNLHHLILSSVRRACSIEFSTFCRINVLARSRYFGPFAMLGSRLFLCLQVSSGSFLRLCFPPSFHHVFQHEVLREPWRPCSWEGLCILLWCRQLGCLRFQRCRKGGRLFILWNLYQMQPALCGTREGYSRLLPGISGKRWLFGDPDFGIKCFASVFWSHFWSVHFSQSLRLRQIWDFTKRPLRTFEAPMFADYHLSFPPLCLHRSEYFLLSYSRADPSQPNSWFPLWGSQDTNSMKS